MKEKAPAMDEVPLLPAKGVAASPTKDAVASPVLIRGLDWAPDSEEERERVTIDREEWRIRRGIRIPYSRCGLIHSEYEITSWIYGFKEFDCKVIFSNIDDLKMDGDTVLLPAHIWMAESDADILDWQNSHFGPSTITRGLVLFLNF
jgi:hypothetical protein